MSTQSRPEAAQVCARNPLSVPKHANNLDEDAKGTPRPPLVPPIAGKNPKNIVFSLF